MDERWAEIERIYHAAQELDRSKCTAYLTKACAGDNHTAIAHYRMAASRTTSMPERNYLIKQAARLSESTPSPDRTI